MSSTRQWPHRLQCNFAMWTAARTTIASLSNSLPSDPNFFPVGAWLMGVRTQRNIDLDWAAVLNFYVGMNANSNFSLVQANGIYLIAQQNELGGESDRQQQFCNRRLALHEDRHGSGPTQGTRSCKTS